MTTNNNTNDYQTKQLVARKIEHAAAIQRWNQHSLFDIYFEALGRLVYDVMQLKETFAAKVAETVDKTMNPYGYKVAAVSNKQAWIIACAVVENNIDYSNL